MQYDFFVFFRLILHYSFSQRERSFLHHQRSSIRQAKKDIELVKINHESGLMSQAITFSIKLKVKLRQMNRQLTKF